MKSAAVEAGLLGCLQIDKPIDEKILKAFTSTDWEAFINLAIQHHLMPLLDYHIRKQGAENLLPDTVKTQFADEVMAQTCRNLAFQGELCKIIAACRKAGIPVIVLKGMHLAPLIYPHISLRHMNDLDLLVRPEDARRMSDVLENLGYMLPQALSEADLEFSLSQHLPVMVKNDFVVEVHGRICKPDKIYSIDTRTWWNNARELEINGVVMSVLDPVDLFLHLCIHISYMHLFLMEIRFFYDLVAILRFYGSDFDWQTLLQRTRERGWERGVLVTLEITRQLFGLNLPHEAVAELGRGEDRALIESTVQDALAELKATAFPEDPHFSQSFADLSFKPGLWNKTCFLWQRVFLPRELLARNYAVKTDSWKFYLYYFVRIKDLLARYQENLLKLIRGDGAVKSAATRKNRLYKWLAKVDS